MDLAHTFARHFARLVWLLLNEGDAFEAQIATLRSVVDASRNGTVTLGARDWRLIVDGQPLPEQFPEAQDLTAQLIGHSVVELTVDRSASPAELLLAARILATEPVPGDGGRAVHARLQALDARSIRARLELPRDAKGTAAPPPLAGMVSDSALFAPAPEGRDADGRAVVKPIRTVSAESAASSRGAPRADGILRQQDSELMFQAFSTTTTPKGSMVKLFEQLDAASAPAAAARQLEALVKLAADSAGREHFDIVADVFHGLVRRESEAADRTIRRQFGMAIRRLCSPALLKCVVELLPRRRENHEQYMAIISRAEDVGAEALVDALVAAPSIADRRVYYDALLTLRTGVRTLIYMLGDHRWYVVRNAADLLGELRVTDAEAELTQLLEHRDDRVRAAASGALAKLGAPATDPPALEHAGSVSSLIRALDREEDARVQMAMLSALGQMGTPEAVDKLAELARTDKGLLARKRPTPLRVAAVHALGEVKSPRALAALQALLRDKEKTVRGAASWVIMGRKS
ncbi:MAG TPA: HEAT repeat domain-containing protein [Gemmatimonadaceae bacterium]|nr:HEAT repeat domain-containing protein [Gemmatimonadaceae bacterium]